MPSFDFPDGQPVTDTQRQATPAWRQTFSRWHDIITSAQQSGTTAQRPLKGLWIGRRYYDDTLGKPVYVRSVNPAVWRDGDNAIDVAIAYDPAALANGAGRTDILDVAGAALGDFVQVAAPYDLLGLLVVPYVQAAGKVGIRLDNNTGAAVDLAAGTWKVRVTR